MPLFSRPVDAILLLLSSLGLTQAAPVGTSDEVPASVQVPENYHAWLISDAEKDRLSKVLEVDFRSLGVDGTFVSTPKEKCVGCGKDSGLEDFVHGVSYYLTLHNFKGCWS